MIARSDLVDAEFNNFYSGYINLVDPNKMLPEVLSDGFEDIYDFFEGVPENKLKKSYAPDKWTILEVFQHLIDTERIFAYRVLCIVRADQNRLAGFEQDRYVDYAHANDRSLQSLLAEYEAVRGASLSLFENLNEEELFRKGNVSGNELSARAAAFIIAGHELHHKIIIENRYL